MKVKVKQVDEEGTNPKEADIARNHWRMRRAARLMMIDMLGQRNKKMILEAKSKPKDEKDEKDLRKLEFITPIGEFALGDNVYVQFNKRFNPGTNMKNLESDTFRSEWGTDWKFEIQDQSEVMRASGGKKITVTLKDAASRFGEEEVKKWLIKLWYYTRNKENIPKERGNRKIP